jgi:dTDP-4-dehydrorhamnose reductase
MLGNVVLRYFVAQGLYSTVGSVRSGASVRWLPKELHDRVIPGIDVENADALARLFAETQPDAVINCIGIVKQLAEAKDPLQIIPINSLLPHRLAQLCAIAGARLVHVSTDCVFSGRKGMYVEADVSDATDLYGRSKYLGEVDYPHAVTLRTSIIGREFGSAHGLVDWFLSQPGSVKGYTKAIFSGLPTVELARVLHDFILPNPSLRGLYHVSSDPIDKCALLRLVAQAYNKTIQVQPDEEVVIDRSLNSTRFHAATGYISPPWCELVARMRDFG